MRLNKKFQILLACAVRLLVATGLLTTLSCSGNNSFPPAESESPGLSAPPLQMLPPIPLELGSQRSSSAVSTSSQDGSAFFSKSQGATVDAALLHLAAATGSLEWAIYQFHPGADALSSVTAQLGYDAGTSTWIGLADYSALNWHFRGPYPASGTAGMSGLSGGSYTSGQGNVYMLVLAYDGTSTTINSIDFSTGTPDTQFGISGTVSISGGGALSGATLTLSPGGLTTQSAANGSYSFSGLSAGTYTVTASKANYSFAPASHNVNLGPSASGVDFSGTAAPQTYSISGKVSDSGSAAISGVTLTLSPGSVTTTSSAAGTYSFSGLAAGNYTVTPSKTGYNFAPVSKAVTLGPDAGSTNFTGTQIPAGKTYTADVKPIFDSLCISCHGASVSFKNVKLETYANASANASAAYAAVLNDSMPMGGRRLTAAEKQTIADWISGGKLQ